MVETVGDNLGAYVDLPFPTLHHNIPDHLQQAFNYTFLDATTFVGPIISEVARDSKSLFRL